MLLVCIQLGCTITDYTQPDLPAVLHNLDFSIKPGEKIGILGRSVTGRPTFIASSVLTVLG